jgi:hypothetical protein
MSSNSSDYRLDKTAFSVVSIEKADDDMAYWLSLPVISRWEAIEINRQLVYGYDPATLRLQRIFSVAQRPSG